MGEVSLIWSSIIICSLEQLDEDDRVAIVTYAERYQSRLSQLQGPRQKDLGCIKALGREVSTNDRAELKGVPRC